ncbi:hypothetical protein ACJMK2_032326, partial [Sinanodonta woodiana]
DRNECLSQSVFIPGQERVPITECVYPRTGTSAYHRVCLSQDRNECLSQSVFIPEQERVLITECVYPRTGTSALELVSPKRVYFSFTRHKIKR